MHGLRPEFAGSLFLVCGVRRVVMKGVGALGDAIKALMARVEFNPREIRWTIDEIRSDAGAVRSAYTTVQGAAGNSLERLR